jgi:DNA repair exonuclease SbcCD ATPase subunit
MTRADLRHEAADALDRLTAELAQAVTAHEKAIEERDEAEEFAGNVYYRIMGRSPEWSNKFGYSQALEEITAELAQAIRERDEARKRLSAYEQAIYAEATDANGFVKTDAEYLEILASYGGRSVSSTWLCEHAKRVRGTIKRAESAEHSARENAAALGVVREALETIAEERDAGRHDGLPEPCPAYDAETMFALARRALSQPLPDLAAKMLAERKAEQAVVNLVRQIGLKTYADPNGGWDGKPPIGRAVVYIDRELVFEIHAALAALSPKESENG